MSNPPPEKKKSKKSKSVKHGDWVQKLDPNSKRYYYGNVKTLERVWVMPEEFRLAADAVAAAKKTKAGASASSASASSSSSSSPSPSTTTTTDAAPAGKADANLKDEWLEGFDPKNKRKYYVNKKTGESRWTKPLAEEEVKADDWISGRDPKTKRVYYYNKRTKETTWEKPPGFTEAGKGKKKSGNTEDAKKVIGQVNKTKPSASAAFLQPKMENDEGATSSKSDSPSLKALKEKRKKKKRPPEAGKSGSMLWISGNDPKTGKIYYFNTTTKETTWTKPTEFKADAKHQERVRKSSIEDGIVKKGIVKERRSSLVRVKVRRASTHTAEAEKIIQEAKDNANSASSGGTKPTPKSKHMRQRSTADEAGALIRQAKEAKAIEDAAAAAAAAAASEETKNHGRNDSSIDDFMNADLMLSSPSLDNVPRACNAVEISFVKLLSEPTEQELSNVLTSHRKRFGGIPTAPLSDIIDAFSRDGGDDSMTPYIEGEDGHRRTISSLDLAPPGSPSKK